MENYFWNTEEIKTEKKVYILVIYDITRPLGTFLKKYERDTDRE